MKISADAVPLLLGVISPEEGDVLRPYKDQAGKWTVGRGHLLLPTDQITGLAYDRTTDTWIGQISEQQSLDLFAADVAPAECAVMGGAPKYAWTQNAFDACVSMAFNCGTGAFMTSHLRQFLVNGDKAPPSLTPLSLQDAYAVVRAGVDALTNASDSFLVFCKRFDPPTGKMVDDMGLLTRRIRERALFLTPDPLPGMR